MFTLSNRQQIAVGLLLIALMAFTRGHHFSTINHLPSASWAVFFLAGFYVSSKALFPLLLLEAGLLDYAGITYGGVSSACISPAYIMLLPAYASLWFAGKWYKNRYQFNWPNLLPLTASVVVASAVSTVLSGGGFYFLSGRYPEPTLVEYGARFINYFPSSLSNIVFYIALAMAFHVLAVSANRALGHQQES